METHETLEESPVITCPSDEELLDKLEHKFQEYTGRIGDSFTHPGQGVVLGLAQGSEVQLDAYVKGTLLRQVLDEKSVTTWDWTKLFLEEDPVINSLGEDLQPLAVKAVARACAVINAYCMNNTTQIVGGTGL